MDVESGSKRTNSRFEDKNSKNTDGLRKRYSNLADDVIERLVTECDTEEQYEKLVSSILAEAPSPESVAALREKLQLLRQLAARTAHREKQKPCMIDDKFLSVLFAVALFAIVGVAIYAFQGLYDAISKKVPISVSRPIVHKSL